jgi:hypothetical protein
MRCRNLILGQLAAVAAFIATSPLFVLGICFAEPAPTDLSCVLSLHLPTDIDATKAEQSGVVTVQIRRLAPDAVDISVSGGSPALQSDVRASMALSHFTGRCKDPEEYIFAFSFLDPQTDSLLPPSVSFLPPNRFEMTFRRRKPISNAASPPRDHK